MKQQPSSITQVNLRPVGRLQNDIAERIEPGKSAGLIGQRDLTRYYEALDIHRSQFSLAEAMLLADALNGCLFSDLVSIQLVWASIDDAIKEDQLDQKWGVDGPAVVQQLRDMTYIQKLAVVDAIERAWNSPTYRFMNMEDRLKEVGLVRR